MPADVDMRTPCPQCGAPLVAPHRVDVFTCPWCKATLRPDEGVPIHYLAEAARLDQESALAAVRAWAAGSDLPAKMEREADFRAGGLLYFPFLRVRRTGEDSVVALAPLPQPEVYELGGVPGNLYPLEDLPEEILVGAPRPDDEVFRDQIKRALDDGGLIDLLVEYRAYYPVMYRYREEPFSLVVGAGSGRVHVNRRPARFSVACENLMLAAAVCLLLAEALFLPGFWVKLIAIALTAGALFPLLRLLIARHG